MDITRRLGLCVTALLISAPALAQQKPAKPAGPPPNTISITARLPKQGGPYEWNEGWLRFGGRTYYFRATGLSIADGAVASRIRAHGKVVNLDRLQDFGSIYKVMPPTPTVPLILRSPAGVEIRFDQITHGATINASADGVRITLR